MKKKFTTKRYGKKRKVIVNKRTQKAVLEVDDHVSIFHSEQEQTLMIVHNGNLVCECKVCNGISALFGFE